jgi:hypothetical protein
MVSNEADVPPAIDATAISARNITRPMSGSETAASRLLGRKAWGMSTWRNRAGKGPRQISGSQRTAAEMILR